MYWCVFVSQIFSLSTHSLSCFFHKKANKNQNPEKKRKQKRNLRREHGKGIKNTKQNRMQ